MFLVLCLLPLVLAAPLETTLNNYKLEIEEADSGKILKNVEFKSDEASELDLSNMNLQNIDEHALDNVRGIKTLNLSNNTLNMLPTSVFSKLTNLEDLSLANNNLRYLENHFVNLKNLRTLDISNNPVSELNFGEKFGLPKTVTIITKNNYLGTVSNRMQGKGFVLYDNVTPDPEEFVPINITSAYIKLCMADGKVKSIADAKADEQVPSECTKLDFVEPGPVFFQFQGITGFQKGWYNLKLSSINLVILAYNNITRITEETLNDLPAHVTDVDLNQNQIRHIHKGIIKNNNLRLLTLEYNEIELIEADAFANTNLESLFLTGNKIADLSFVPSLPQTLKYLHLTANDITSIPEGIFTNVHNLNELYLDSNRISRVQNQAFDGLSSLEELRLTNNNMTEIEPEAFKGLVKLERLMCGENLLTSFPSNVWSPLKNLKVLHLDRNRMTKITKDMFSSLPKTLESLYLSWNGISIIDSDSFNEVPEKILDLSYNEISDIPRGALSLPKLKELYLTRNKLSVIDPESYETVPELTVLTLSDNGISDVVKGSCKNFGKLEHLDLSENPIKELKNGALYGLNAENFRYVSVYGNKLEKIEGGVFEDV